VFNGIIQVVGKVIKYDGIRLSIRAPLGRLQRGESVSVDGVCLTVVNQKGSVYSFDVGPETTRITTLGSLAPGTPVNLERSMRWGDRIGGHFVTGHVEQTGLIERIRREGSSKWYRIRLPKRMAKYVRFKGSIAVDGISLTVARKNMGRIDIMIIPHTLRNTGLSAKKAGDRVNLEADILAQYTGKTKKEFLIILRKAGT
jgi:riboflavin synthase